jgi:hypothetical protein
MAAESLKQEKTVPEFPIIEDPEKLFALTQPKYIFVKPELTPGQPGYYEVTALQVPVRFLEATPGFKVKTTEQPLGQVVQAGDWIITRTHPILMYTQHWPIKDVEFNLRWKPVRGKLGYYSPKSVATEMVELAECCRIKTNWGPASGGPGSFLVKYGTNNFNIITDADLEFTYVGTDELSNAKLELIRAKLASAQSGNG